MPWSFCDVFEICNIRSHGLISKFSQANPLFEILGAEQAFEYLGTEKNWWSTCKEIRRVDCWITRLIRSGLGWAEHILLFTNEGQSRYVISRAGLFKFQNSNYLPVWSGGGWGGAVRRRKVAENEFEVGSMLPSPFATDPSFSTRSTMEPKKGESSEGTDRELSHQLPICRTKDSSYCL